MIFRNLYTSIKQRVIKYCLHMQSTTEKGLCGKHHKFSGKLKLRVKYIRVFVRGFH